MSIDINKCKIEMVVDSREKCNQHITGVWQAKGIDYYIKEKGLKTGDYSIDIQTPAGEVISFEDKVVIERKS